MIRLCVILLRVALVLSMSLIFEGARLWLLVKPAQRFRAWRGRRRLAKTSWATHHLDEVPEDFNATEEEKRLEINLGTRTSTNALVGGGLFSQIYVQLVGLIPGDGAVEGLLLQPEAVAFAAVLFATLIARISKTPANPGKL